MDENEIGRRIREVRSWRGMALRTAADLAGFSYGYLAQIERGEKPVNSRNVLEAIAFALRVDPSQLTGQPWAPVDTKGKAALATVADVETALEVYERGHDPGVELRPWPELASDIAQLMDLTHVHADYAAQGALVPRLLAELHAAYVRLPERRADVLLALIHCYSSACWTTKRLGGRGLPTIAARLAQECAEELGLPAWIGYATWLRGDATGQLSRDMQYRRCVSMADQLSGALDDADVAQAYGMLQLSAALAAAARADRDTAELHLTEAAGIAARLEAEVGSFAHLWFGRTNVGIWRVGLATEFGDGPKVAEIARDVHPELIPSPSRQAEFWADLGRAMFQDAKSRDQGLTALLRAEELAPQRIRNDVFVREAVSDQLRRARRESGGRELRGLAYRMGVAPNG
ncbi:Putative transcriptional regulator [Alloactinosynnema sp. L-07]|uniref:helix-turn-helix domain-containing protein n=1 Tax=Alloactinosynnema sp. L-07 TaxID=1653480 RepID=UPI00065F06E7|nr:helix-turn-helix transcriptional regulator [Alloactinosynnema sp. L-07]CRK55464.1 Putative transcriptional regulator [Alloactinosynnema sp. L-07]